MMLLSKLRDVIHDRLNRIRALDRLVTSKRFEAAFRIDSESLELQAALAHESPENVEIWLNKVLVKELDDMSVRELRIRATRLQIPFYTTYPKTALILKILEVQDNARKAEQATLDLPLSQADDNSTCIGECERELPCTTGIGGTVHSGIQDGQG